MIVTCPSCETHFAVSDAALASGGRTLRCGRCGHKWHQFPAGTTAPPPPSPTPAEEIPLEMPPADAAEADGDAMESEDKPFDFDPKGGDAVPFDLGPAMEQEAPGEAGEAVKKEEEDPFAKIAELMMQTSPDPIPDMFSVGGGDGKPKKRGIAGLIVLVVAVVLAGLGGALFFLQDKVIDTFPATARVYERLGIHKEVVGAGLAFSQYQSERLSQDGNEVLVVRGVISNTTDQARSIPLLRLVLYEDQTPLQERVISPPQSSLDPKAGVGFRITLDQPDPHATRFAVTFTAAPPPSH